MEAALTDLFYLLVAAIPAMRAASRWWTRHRYRGLAPSYEGVARRDPQYLVPLRRVLANLDADPLVVVEVAAGTGIATEAISARCVQAIIIAVDLSPAMLSRLAVPPAGRIRRVVGDGWALPIQSGSADMVLAHNAPFCLREMGRIVRPKAIAAVVLSSAGWVPRWLSLWALRRSAGGKVSLVAEHRGGAGAAWLFRPATAARPGAATR